MRTTTIISGGKFHWNQKPFLFAALVFLGLFCINIYTAHHSKSHFYQSIQTHNVRESSANEHFQRTFSAGPTRQLASDTQPINLLLVEVKLLSGIVLHFLFNNCPILYFYELMTFAILGIHMGPQGPGYCAHEAGQLPLFPCSFGSKKHSAISWTLSIIPAHLTAAAHF